MQNPSISLSLSLVYQLYSLPGTVSFLLFHFEMRACVRQREQAHPLNLPQKNPKTAYDTIRNHNNAYENNWFASARWQMYHVTQAQLWNEERREIMESRLVEQHWTFTPPPSLIFMVCLRGESPPVFLSFYAENTLVLNHLNQSSFFFIRVLSTIYTMRSLCSYLCLSVLCTYIIHISL